MKGDMLVLSLRQLSSKRKPALDDEYSTAVRGAIKLRSGRTLVANDWERERETFAGAMGGEYCPLPWRWACGMDGDVDGDDDGEKVGNGDGELDLDTGRSST